MIFNVAPQHFCIYFENAMSDGISMLVAYKICYKNADAANIDISSRFQEN